MNSHFKKDLYRFYGEDGEGFVKRIFRPMEIRHISLIRKAQYSKTSFMRLYYTIRLKMYSKKSLIRIPPKTQIGDGFYIGHSGRVIIHPDSKLGENVNVGTGVTIGMQNRGKNMGAPQIGNRVWIGTNAVVVGNVKIGDDVLIAPLSYVNFDVPDHSVVIGNPGKIIPKENATEGYVCNLI